MAMRDQSVVMIWTNAYDRRADEMHSAVTMKAVSNVRARKAFAVNQCTNVRTLTNVMIIHAEQMLCAPIHRAHSFAAVVPITPAIHTKDAQTLMNASH